MDININTKILIAVLSHMIYKGGEKCLDRKHSIFGSGGIVTVLI